MSGRCPEVVPRRRVSAHGFRLVPMLQLSRLMLWVAFWRRNGYYFGVMGDASVMRSLKSGLVSIGYEGRTAEELLTRLVELGVSTLVDVRLTPLSRKPGLSKTRLGAACAVVGIHYVHLPSLGNPKENREPFRSGHASVGCIRFSALLAEPAAVASMDQLEALVRDARTAVLCFEREHVLCHRQVIVDELVARLGEDSELIHA